VLTHDKPQVIMETSGRPHSSGAVAEGKKALETGWSIKPVYKR
jgi:hypothetical protein